MQRITFDKFQVKLFGPKVLPRSGFAGAGNTHDDHNRRGGFAIHSALPPPCPKFLRAALQCRAKQTRSVSSIGVFDTAAKNRRTARRRPGRAAGWFERDHEFSYSGQQAGVLW